MLKGFRNFLMQGNVIVVAIGLMVALAFSTLIAAFTTNIIDPLISRAQGSHAIGLGVQLGHHGNAKTFMNFGAFISAIIYFLIFMAVLYFLIVVPFRAISARRGVTVFGPPAATKSCPYCLAATLPAAATKCQFCASELPTESQTTS